MSGHLKVWIPLGAALLLPSWAGARVRVVASTADLAYFAGAIGGDLVEADAIAHPAADVHFVEVRPSFMVKLKRADLAVKVGLELDIWMDRLIDGSRNGNLTVVDCSKYVEPLEVPALRPDARSGDLHRFGNPHYWLTPENAEPITRAILEGLRSVDPGHAEVYRHRRDSFLSALAAELPELRRRAALLSGTEIISYHQSWSYLCAFTGMAVAGFIEPYPGVPPSPSHVADLVHLVRRRKLAIIAVEPYFDRRVPEKIARETGARVVTLYPSIGGRRPGESYAQFLLGNIEALIGAQP